MSALRLDELLAAVPGPYQRAADAWRLLALELDDAAEAIIHGGRQIQDVWTEGVAAEQAQARSRELQRELSNAYQPARQIWQALDHHAHALTQLRNQATTLIDEARRRGYVIDLGSGQVTGGPPPVPGAWPDPSSQARQSYASQIAEIIERARALDDTTCAALNGNLPDLDIGFGALPPAQLTRQEVADQQGRPPQDVSTWWLNLTPEQQEQALDDYPDLVGWLDGVPATDRDRANRSVLARTRSDLQAREDELRRRIDQLRAHPGHDRASQTAAGAELYRLTAELAGIDARQASLDKVEAGLAKAGERGLLLGIDTVGDGRAVIAVGNPDTARHTAVWVPGLGTTLDSTPGNVDRVINLQEATDRLMVGSPDTVATVMWLGYDAPEVDLSVVTGDRSRAGAEPLNRFVDGLRAAHDPGAYHVTAVGHSYGSTVVGEAAMSGRLHVDDIITAGSPGTHANRADQLMVDPHHVWAGSARGDGVSDPVVHHGRYESLVPIVGPLISRAEDAMHGVSPHQDGFGANRFVVDTHGHSDYWTRETLSIRNQAAIVVGRYSETTIEHGQRPPNLG